MATMSLIVICFIFVLASALLRLFYPELYAKYLLRTLDEQSRREWLQSSSRGRPIAALVIVVLLLILFDIALNRKH